MNKRVVRPSLIVVVSLLLVAIVAVSGYSNVVNEAAAPQFETRCGWLSNPTPGNIWLYDREGEWTIGVQGGYQVEGDWDWPDFKPGQWVRTNGDYGYGCACLQMRVDKDNHKVLEIKSARARPLATCRRDASLKRWKNMLK